MEAKKKPKVPKPEKEEEQRQDQSSGIKESDKEVSSSQSSSQQLKVDVVRQISSIKQKANNQIKLLQNKVSSLTPGKSRHDEDLSQESRQGYSLYDKKDSPNLEFPSGIPGNVASPISPLLFTRTSPISTGLPRETGRAPVPMASISPTFQREGESSPRLVLNKNNEPTPASNRPVHDRRSMPIKYFPTPPLANPDISITELEEVALCSVGEDVPESGGQSSGDESSKYIIVEPIPYSDLTENLHSGKMYYYRSIPIDETLGASRAPASCELPSASVYEMQHPNPSLEHSEGSACTSRSHNELIQIIPTSSSTATQSYDPSPPTALNKYGKHARKGDNEAKAISKGGNVGDGTLSAARTLAGTSERSTSHGTERVTIYNVGSPPSLTGRANISIAQAERPQGRPGIHRPAPSAPSLLHSTISQSPGPLRGYDPSTLIPYRSPLPPPLPLPPTALLQGYNTTGRYLNQPPFRQQQMYLEIPATPADRESEPSTPHSNRDVSATSEATRSKILRGWSNLAFYVRRKSSRLMGDAQEGPSSPTTQPPRSRFTSMDEEDSKPQPRRHSIESHTSPVYPDNYSGNYEALLQDLACCCCWPLGLSARLITKMNPSGGSPVDSCVQSMSKQLTICALLVGIAFYLFLCVVMFSLVFIAASKP